METDVLEIEKFTILIFLNTQYALQIEQNILHFEILIPFFKNKLENIVRFVVPLVSLNFW